MIELDLSKQCTCFLELQTWSSRMKAGAVAIAEIAKEIGLDMACREELLLAPFTFLSGSKKFFVQPGIVEA